MNQLPDLYATMRALVRLNEALERACFDLWVFNVLYTQPVHVRLREDCQ